MYYPNLALLGLLAASLVTGYVVSPLVDNIFARQATSKRCGTPEPDAEYYRVHGPKIQAVLEDYKKRGQLEKARADGLHIDVYMHSIAVSKDKQLSVQLLDKQQEAIRAAWSPWGIIFNFKPYTFKEYPWAETPKLPVTSENFKAMKEELHKGDFRTLNLYLVPSFEEIGVCFPPFAPLSGRDPLLDDGCIISSTTIPGGSLNLFNQGKTAAHEIGHWLGLFHTYTGGCGGDGDEVSDTPAQAKDCGQGLDPIFNYMGDNCDSCMTEFTQGQIDRTLVIWNAYRA